MEDFLVKKYYFKWVNIIQLKQIQEQINNDVNFIIQDFIDSDSWCWDCKYSYCKVHSKKIKCTSKTQRGRNCHCRAIRFFDKQAFCQYH